MANNFHSGKYGTGTVNGVEIPLISWDVEPTVDIVRFLNSKTGSYPKREATFYDASVTLVFDLDFDAYPFATPINLIPGQIVTAKLYMRQTANSALNGDFWQFPKTGLDTSSNGLVVQSAPMSLNVDGKIGTSVSCLITGAFAWPTGISPT